MQREFHEKKNTAMPDYPYMDKYRKNLSNPPHYHDEIEVIAVLAGSVTVYSSFGTVKADAGDIAVLMPREVHNFSTEQENRVYVMKLHCQNSKDSNDLTKYRFSGSLIKSGTELNKAVFSHIHAMAEVYDDQKIGAAYEANAHSHMIVSLIISSELCNPQDPDASLHSEATIRLLRHVTEYIDAHLNDRISLECIAAHCNMSKYYFAHTFKETMGVTFLDYLTSYRMNIAIRLLSETNKTITEISYLSGFSTLRIFNHLFKAKFGISPSEYRKKIRQQHSDS